MRTAIVTIAVLLLSCNTNNSHKQTSYVDSLNNSKAASAKNDKELSESLNAVNLELYYNKVKFSSDFDSLLQKKLFLGHVFIMDVCRVNSSFLIKGANDEFLSHYTFDLRCDSADADFIGHNLNISLEFYSNQIRKILKDSVPPLQNTIMPVYHISGTIIKAIRPVQ